MSREDRLIELQERVKELTCFYEIASIAQRYEGDPSTFLSEAVRLMPPAWKHPAYAVAEIRVDQQSYLSGDLPQAQVCQEAPLYIEGQLRGRLRVCYPASQFGQQEFLPEEQPLLERISAEIATRIERHEKKEQQQLIERRLQHSDRLSILGELTAGIAHELNTPLGNILGYAQLMLTEKQDTRTRKDLERIITSSIHAREIVKKLMFFACEIPNQFEYADLNKLIADSLRLLENKIKAESVQTLLQLHDNLPRLKLDSVQVTQVFFNLVINALHAMRDKGGTLTIATRTEKDHVLLTVADTGHGIPEAIRDKIFQPFYTTKPVGEGSGLGLSVVHGIVKAHGGTIGVNAVSEGGTAFHIRFPLTLPDYAE